MNYRRSITIFLCLTLVLVFAQAGFPGVQPGQAVFAADTDPNTPDGPQKVYLPLISTDNNNVANNDTSNTNTKWIHAAANGSSQSCSGRAVARPR